MPRGPSWQPQTSSYAKRLSSAFDDRRPGTWSNSTRRNNFLISSLRQREHREVAAERGVVAQRRVAANSAETRGWIGQTGREADAGPAADPGQYRHVLPAALLIGGDVADDAGWGLELVELLAGLGVDRLEVALQRAVEHHTTGGGQRTRPDRELLLVRPGDLAGLAVPGDEVTHVGLAGRRIHRQRRPNIGLACRVAHLERLVVHADLVGRHIEQLGIRRIGRRLFVLGAEGGRADALVVMVLALLVGRVLIDNLGTAIGRRVLVHVDAGGPVDLRIILFGNQQFAGGAVERIAEPVAVEVDRK